MHQGLGPVQSSANLPAAAPLTNETPGEYHNDMSSDLALNAYVTVTNARICTNFHNDNVRKSLVNQVTTNNEDTLLEILPVSKPRELVPPGRASIVNGSCKGRIRLEKFSAC